MPCLSAFFLAVLLALGLLAPAASAGDDLDLAAKLPVDDKLELVETLPNGLEVWVRPHAMPQGKVMLMLHIGSGSLQEEENQRGLAHYLEHMAFNGSENFPAGEVVSFFEKMGLVFGQHQNAFTSFDQTTYMLSLPDVKKETLEKGLLFFADVASRLTLSEKEVDKERGVILEEARSRAGVQMRMMEKALPMLMPGSRLAERIPIGDLDVIRETKADRLRAYYERWYRPEHSVLLVIGDVKAADVKPLIAQALGGWKGKGEAPVAIGSGITLRQGLEAGVLTDPEQVDALLTFSTTRPLPSAETVGDFRRSLVENIGERVVNQRLRTMVQENTAAFQAAEVGGGQTMVDHEMGGFAIQARADRWQEGLAQVLAEIQRLREFGLHEGELERIKSIYRSSLERAAETEATRPAQSIAMGLNRAVTEGRTPMAAAQRRDLAKRLLEGISDDEIVASFRANLDPSNGLVMLALPEGREGVAVPSEEELLAVYRAGLAAEVEQGEAQTAVGTILAQDPTPQAPKVRLTDEAMGVTTLVYANGVRVNIRPMPEVESVTVQISMLGGLPDETAPTRAYTEAAAQAYAPGRMATKSLSPSQITRYLEPLKVSVGGGQDDSALSLTVAGEGASIEEGLRLAWLLLTEPRLDAGALEQWKQEADSALEQLAVTIPAQAMIAVQRVASGGDVRFTLPDAAHYAGIDLEKAQSWLEGIVRKAPMEVAIVGNIELAEAVRLADTWFGALPARSDDFAGARDKRRVKAPTGPVLEDVAVDTITPMAVVVLGWRGVGRDDSANQIALVHAGSMLNTRLMEAVREEKGLTYQIGSGYQYTDYEDMDGLVVQFVADPAKAMEATKIARETVLELGQTGPTDDEVASTAKQMANIFDEEMQQPGFWIQALRRLHANGRTMAVLKQRLALLRAPDKASIQAALEKILQDERFARVVIAPKSALPLPGSEGEGDAVEPAEAEAAGIR